MNNVVLSYKTADTEKITEFAIGLFMFYWKDDTASRFRKMLMIERYRNPELNRIYDELFVNGAVEYEEKIFAELIDAGVIKKEDPHLIALRFYSPIIGASATIVVGAFLLVILKYIIYFCDELFG